MGRATWPVSIGGIVVVLAASGCPKPAATRAVTDEPPGATAQSPPPAAPASVVFFADRGELVAPLGCYDAGRDTLAGGADCLALIDPGATLLVGGARFTAGAVRTDVCEGAGSDFQVLAVEGDPTARDAPDPHYGLWPPDAAIELTIATKPLGPGKTLKVRSEALERLRELAIAAAGVETADVLVDQLIHADLDGDGAVDSLMSAYIPQAPQHGPEYLWTGFVLRSGATGELRVLHTSTYERIHVKATLDLDGDGALEVWYRAWYYEGSYDHVGRFEAGDLKSLGAYGCGA